MLLRAIKAGSAPYHIGDLALGTTASGETLHVLLSLRNDALEPR